MSFKGRERQTRVLLVDDHPLVRQALKDLLAREPDIAVCGEADDRNGALAAVAESKPDLAIVDLRLRDSDGLELIRDIHHRNPETRTLCLSMYDESVCAEQAIRAGACGYISKIEATTNLMDAVRRVLSGQIYPSYEAAARMAPPVAARPGCRSSDSPDDLFDGGIAGLRMNLQWAPDI
jgi:DNA-binding NarL/FixJ family response regulator